MTGVHPSCGISQRGANDVLAAGAIGVDLVTLAGRGRRLWLAGAEEALASVTQPAGLAWELAGLGLRGAVVPGADLSAERNPVVIMTPLKGQPGAHYAHLKSLTGLLLATGISCNARLAWAPGELWLYPLPPPSIPDAVPRRLRADGRISMGRLRAYGPLPRQVRISVCARPGRVEFTAGLRLASSDPAVFPVRGPSDAPYVMLSGSRGTAAREALGATRRDVWVWVWAEPGRLVAEPVGSGVVKRRRAS